MPDPESFDLSFITPELILGKSAPLAAPSSLLPRPPSPFADMEPLTLASTILDDDIVPTQDDPGDVLPEIETVDVGMQATPAPPPPPPAPPVMVDAGIQTVIRPSFKRDRPTPPAVPQPKAPVNEDELFSLTGPAPTTRADPKDRPGGVFHTAAAIIGHKRPEHAPEGDVDRPFAQPVRSAKSRRRSGAKEGDDASPEVQALMDDPRLNAVPPHLVQLILGEVADAVGDVGWEDVVGLGEAKRAVTEAVIWPLKRPDLFQALGGPRGVLLFGPPGNGKTLIGRAIAKEAGATFFNISASSLMSKWAGEGEKLVRALFAVARIRSPSIVFIDEIDSILSQRGDDDANTGSRRMKTEFLVQIDGGASGNENVILLAATNRPSDIDEAARRRFTKRLYVPLPDGEGRLAIVRGMLRSVSITDDERAQLVADTELFSGADLKTLCHEAAMGPIREAMLADQAMGTSQVRGVAMTDLQAALKVVRPSVDKTQLGYFEEWNDRFGSG